MSDSPFQYNYPVVFRWNVSGDCYNDGCVLYADGLLEINVGGRGTGRYLRGWFETQKRINELEQENKRLKEALEEGKK